MNKSCVCRSCVCKSCVNKASSGVLACVSNGISVLDQKQGKFRCVSLCK